MCANSRMMLRRLVASPLGHTRRGFSVFAERLQQERPPLLMGCVCYDPSVGDIWSGIKDYLVMEKGVPFDYVLFTNYTAQVRSLVREHIDVAWNGPIAHVMLEELAAANNQSVVSLGMRDVDRDCQSIVVVRKDAHISTLQDLHNQDILTGSSDSPQAHLVPMYYLQQEMGISPKCITPFDVDIGKHGDTAIGEIQALEALVTTTSKGDAAIVSRMMWDRAIQGMIPSLNAAQLQETCEELVSVHLPAFDHCQFDAILSNTDNGTTDKKQRLHDFGQALLSMDWNVPNQQRLMKLEGIQKEWVGPRQTGYNIVRNAMRAQHHPPATNFQYRSFSTQQQQQRKVAVVGAGVAGLQAVRALKAHGFPVTAFEASSTVGGLWQANYANFGVQVPKQLYEFQDYPMESVSRGEYATGPQVQAYIENYANDFDLRDSIQFNTKVTSVAPRDKSDNESSWSVETESSDGKREIHDFDYVVVATGLYSGQNKVIPSKPGQESFSGDIVHSSEFYDASVAKNKRVVVIGSGKSAVDCAIEASRAGASSVTLLQRSAHWPTPRKIAGLIPFQYIFLSRLGTALVSAHQGTFPGGSGKAVNAFRNSVVGPLLMRPVFRLVEELFAFQFGLRGELRPKGDVVSDFYNVALVLNSDLKEMRKAGKITVQLGEIEKYESDGTTVMLKDGSSVDADLIICATGFRDDYSIFSDPATRKSLDLQDDGIYLYRYMLPEKVPNLAFIGHVGAISNMSSYGLQGEWLARKLSGTLVSGGTTTKSVHEEIEVRKAWARSWMPKSAKRGMLVLLHQTHYHDQLLRDMGLNPHRKSNILSEYLMPYEPADYDGIMGGGTQR